MTRPLAASTRITRTSPWAVRTLTRHTGPGFSCMDCGEASCNGLRERSLNESRPERARSRQAGRSDCQSEPERTAPTETATQFASNAEASTMSARAIWKGHLVLGKQEVPIKMYSAVQD